MSRQIPTSKIPTHGLGAVLTLASRAFTRAMQQRLAPYGVATLEWTHLRFLGEEDGITQAELCRRMGIQKPSSIPMLNRLVRRKFVRRARDPNDGRKLKLYLTPEGRAMRDTIAPIGVSMNKEAREGIPVRDVVAFFRVALAITANCAIIRPKPRKKQGA